MREYIIKKNDHGIRVDRFIKRITIDLPNSVMYKMIRKKDVLVNGKRVEKDTILHDGDRLEIYIHDKYLKGETDFSFLESNGGVSIIYEDENILVLEKPIGLLSHSSKNEYEDSLVFRIWKYLYNKKEYNPEEENSFSPALCGRLDRNTGGIVLAGKNAEALRYFNKLMSEGLIERKYLAVIEGMPKQSTGSIKSAIKKDSKSRKAVVKDGIQAETRYSVIKMENFNTLVEVELVTGKFHQIRAHFSAIGHPLVGDIKYGARKEKNLGHQALYAYKIRIKTRNDYEKPENYNFYNDMTFEAKNIPKIYNY